MFESRRRHTSNTEPSNINEISMVAPTGFEPVFGRGRVFAIFSNEFGNGFRPESRPDWNAHAPTTLI